MSSSSTLSQHSSHPDSIDPAEVARLKRRLAAAQEEVKELSGTKPKKSPCVKFFYDYYYDGFSFDILTLYAMALL